MALTTLTHLRWADTTILSSEVAAAVGELRAKPGRELQVHGSGTLIRWLLDNDLVDEINLLTFPVVLGQGTRLFPDTGPDRALELVESRATPRGVTIQVLVSTIADVAARRSSQLQSACRITARANSPGIGLPGVTTRKCQIVRLMKAPAALGRSAVRAGTRFSGRQAAAKVDALLRSSIPRSKLDHEADTLHLGATTKWPSPVSSRRSSGANLAQSLELPPWVLSNRTILTLSCCHP